MPSSSSQNGKRGSTTVDSSEDGDRSSPLVFNDLRLRALFASSYPGSDDQPPQAQIDDITLVLPPTMYPKSPSVPQRSTFETQYSSQNLLATGELPSGINKFVPVTAVEPGPVWPTADQLYVANGYGVRRTDGFYTALIRADLLPTEVQLYLGTPDRQGPEGLIIVPEPVQPAKAVRPIPTVHTSVRIHKRLTNQ
jgi:hypothetical protein